jgi:hypothetical protein
MVTVSSKRIKARVSLFFKGFSKFFLSYDVIENQMIYCIINETL